MDAGGRPRATSEVRPRDRIQITLIASRGHVLVAADPNHDVLVVHPITELDAMVTAHHASERRVWQR